MIRIVPDTETQRMMFESGELDLLDLENMPDAVDDLTASYPDQIVSGPRVGTTYFALNENVEPLGDVRVRKALQQAIDRQAILDALFGGQDSWRTASSLTDFTDLMKICRQSLMIQRRPRLF